MKLNKNKSAPVHFFVGQKRLKKGGSHNNHNSLLNFSGFQAREIKHFSSTSLFILSLFTTSIITNTPFMIFINGSIFKKVIIDKNEEKIEYTL